MMGWFTALVPMPYRILGMVVLIVGEYFYAHHEGAVEQHNEDVADQARTVQAQLKAARTLHDADQAALTQSAKDRDALRNKLFQTQQGVQDVLTKYNDLVRNPRCDLPPVLMCIFNGGDPAACEKGQAGSGHDPVPAAPTKNRSFLGGRHPVPLACRNPGVRGLLSKAEVAVRVD